MHPVPDYILGLDIGGTHIKALAITPSGQVLTRHLVPTGDHGSQAWLQNVRHAFASILEQCQRPPVAVGVAAPGLPRLDQRAMQAMPGRLPGLIGLEWAPFLGFPRTIPVLNDAQAALQGECWLGAARDCTHAILVTLGTGVGGAVLCDGLLLRGRLGRAGHLGHISLNPDGAPDITGCPGSLEDAFGDATLARRSGGRFTSTLDLVRAHLAGDGVATDIWLRSVKALAAALASFTNLFDPEIIVVGGGIASAGTALFEPLARDLARFEWNVGAPPVRLVPATLGSEAGAIGAARAALDFH